jgi:serine phosphatase RsbU (regulator of sigma subunit)/HAMP domain-containing protein
MEAATRIVRFSVGTKLVLSVVTLLVVSLALLDVSTIVLLESDKRSSTYQAQATEALVAGRDFVQKIRFATDTLRVVLGSVDPRNAIGSTEKDRIQGVLNNQSDLLSLATGTLKSDPGATSPELNFQSSREEELGRLGIQESELKIPVELWKDGVPTLLKKGVLVLNASILGKVLLLGVAIVDLAQATDPRGIPIAVGFISLQGWGSEFSSGRLSIANRDGWVLFDSEPTVVYSKKNLLDDTLFALATSSPQAGGAQDFEADGRRLLGSFFRPGLDLVVLNRTDWRRAMAASSALSERLVLLGLMVVGAAIILATLFSKTLSSPIARLYEATRAISEGNFELNLSSRSRDELGALTDSFNTMSRKIVDLIDEQVKKAHLENEVAIASTVQQTLIPPTRYEDSRVLIHSHYQSATECGGDWWGFFGVGRKMSLMIADATGHGLPSALITASARSCFSVMQKLAQEDPEFAFSPSAMLSFANRVVHDAANGRIMMTFFIASIDFDTGELRYSSAGHNPPWLFKSQGGGSFQLRSLTAVGSRLGEARDCAPFEEKVVEVAPGDVLFMYTDGLVEGTSQETGAAFGKKKARQVVEAAVPQGPDHVIQEIVNAFLAHNGPKPLDDDMTLASVLFKGGRG